MKKLDELLNMDIANDLYNYILKEYKDPDPTSGRTVEWEIEPLFNEICKYIGSQSELDEPVEFFDDWDPQGNDTF